MIQSLSVRSSCGINDQRAPFGTTQNGRDTPWGFVKENGETATKDGDRFPSLLTLHVKQVPVG